MVLKSLVIAFCVSVSPLLAKDSRSTKSVDAFNKIETEGPLAISLVQGPKPMLNIEGPISIVKDLEVKVNNGRLIIDNNADDEEDQIKVEIVTDQKVSSVEISGATKFASKNQFTKEAYLTISGASTVSITDDLDKLKIESAGASKIHLEDIKIKHLEIEMAGASKAKISGSGDSFDLDMAGAAAIKGSKFTVKNATIEAAGAANIELDVRDYLKAETFGASRIRYVQKPKKITSSGIISSSISKL